MRGRLRRWRDNGASAVVWIVGVTVLITYAQTTTDGDKHLPSGLGAVAFLFAAAWTLWTFRGL